MADDALESGMAGKQQVHLSICAHISGVSFWGQSPQSHMMTNMNTAGNAQSLMSAAV
jgi:hypothetical protein